jgi:hypothetical protein
VITQEWIDQIDEALKQACPLASADEEAMTDVMHKIQEFLRASGRLPEEIQVITEFAVPHENRLLQEQQSVAIAARKKERLDYLSGEGATREAVIADLRERRVSDPVRKAYVPEREFSQYEIDQMSDEEAKRVLFGQESLGLNKQSSKVDPSAPKNELDEYHRNKILNYRGRDPIIRGLKRQLLDGTEQRDIDYRRRVLEQQKADRKKVAEQLRAADAARKGK